MTTDRTIERPSPLVDLRAFLDVLRREGELVEIDAPVDPDLEGGAGGPCQS